MQEFGTSTSEGSRTLLADEQLVAGGGIGDLQAWAASQAARLAALRSELPLPVVAQADSSIALLDRVLGRTEALRARADCSEIISGIVDEVGALPAEGLCAPRPATPETEEAEAARAAPGPRPRPAGVRAAPGVNAATPDAERTGVPTESPTAVGGEGERLSTTSEDELSDDARATTPDPDPTPGEGTAVPLPLPLVPPITMPSLLPGGGVITIGG